MRRSDPNVATADALLRRGEWPALRDLAESLADADRRIPAWVAWRAAAVHHHAGRFDEALGFVDRADLDGDPVDAAYLLAARASAHWARGSLADARSAADLALAEATRGGDDAALANAYVAQALVFAAEGDRHRNRRSYDLALARAESAGDLLTQVRILNNLGSAEIEEGRYAAALGFLDLALNRCDEGGPLPLGAALARLNRAEALLGLGRVEEALAELEPARRTYLALDAPFLGHVLLTIGDADRIRGRAAMAAAAYREAVAAVTSAENAQVLVPALSGLARTCIVDDPDEARSSLKRALEQPAALGSVVAVLAAGWLALADGEHDRALDLSRAAEREAGRRHDLPRLAEALELRALVLAEGIRSTQTRVLDQLAEARTVWADTDNPIGLATNAVLVARLAGDRDEEDSARAALRALGVRDDAHRIAGPLMAVGGLGSAGLTIRTLGGFVVTRDGVPVTTSAWQSRKSRDLIKILAGKQGRAVTRDALGDWLWPGVRGAGGRLSVALSTARHVLDPDKRHPSDHYLVADRAAIRLDTRHVSIDALDFATAAHRALAVARAARADHRTAVERLERAAALYTGHHLADDAFDGWAGEVRDELRALSFDVRRELAGVLAAGAHPERAVPWLVGLVADDPYDEPSHRDLVRGLVRAGRHGEARRYYRTYAERMRELGAAPAPFSSLTTLR